MRRNTYANADGYSHRDTVRYSYRDTVGDTNGYSYSDSKCYTDRDANGHAYAAAASPDAKAAAHAVSASNSVIMVDVGYNG